MKQFFLALTLLAYSAPSCAAYEPLSQTPAPTEQKITFPHRSSQEDDIAQNQHNNTDRHRRIEHTCFVLVSSTILILPTYFIGHLLGLYNQCHSRH